MPVPKLLAAATRTTATGVLGVAAVEAGRRVVRRGGVRAGAVTVTRWALLGRRQAEIRAESARLTGADILAEAKAGIGEQALPPQAAAHDHDH